MIISELRGFFVLMYSKVSMRTNPRTDRYSGYYRLVESYRDSNDRICHRTMLNAGYPDELNTDQLNLIQKILTAKVASPDQPLPELPFTDDAAVIHYVDEFYTRMVAEKRIDVLWKRRHPKTGKIYKLLITIVLGILMFARSEPNGCPARS